MTERAAAYRRKFSIVAEELGGLPVEVEGLNPLERRGVLHAVQVAVDAAMDLAAMAVKDRGRDVQDDYHNLQVLVEEGVLEPALAAELTSLNGLRNAIVHKYNRFEEAAVLEKPGGHQGHPPRVRQRAGGGSVKEPPLLEHVRRDLQRLRAHEVVLHGSALTGHATPRSDVDVAVVTRDADAGRNRALWLRLLAEVPDRYDLRVYELLPLSVQVRIAERHAVVFGDPVELSYYFYRYRRRWKDQARRHRENQFRSFREKLDLLEARRRTAPR